MMYRIAEQGKCVPLSAEDSHESALEQRLLRARRWHIEYGRFLSNHLTHNWVVMALGGAPAARLDWWESVYTDPQKSEPLEPAWIIPSGPVPGPLDPVSLDRLLCCGMQHFPSLQVAFDREVAAHGRVAAAQRYVPALLPGLAGAAFHPLIHLGLGLEAGSDSMVADAMAYWICVYQPLGGACPRWQANKAGDSVAAPAEQLLAQLANARRAGLHKKAAAASQSPPIVARQRGEFQHRLMTFADPAWPMLDWLDEASVLQLPANASSERLLHELRSVVTHWLVASRSEFFVLHALTSLHALGTLLSILPEAERWLALAAWYRAALATLIGQGFPGFDRYTSVTAGTDGSTADDVNWPALRAQSWSSFDEHVPKAVYALSCWAGESRVSADRLSFAQAARALLKAHPSGDVGENLWIAR